MEYREFLEGRRSTGLSPWVFLVATTLNTLVVAALAALIVGMLRHDIAAPQASRSSYQALPASSFSATTAPQRVVDIARIGGPDHPFQMEAGKPIRFPLSIFPESAATASYFLVISGLPPTTTLTGANRIGSDSWFLPPRANERIEITVANPSDRPIPFKVQLRHTTGGIAGETDGWIFVSRPAAGTAAKPPPMPAGLLESAEQLLARGDIAGARVLFQRAADAGSAEAALSLGATYDPNRLWVRGVFGMSGNKEQARRWYMRAERLGHPDAKARIVELGH